jgi:hypothetical protein
MRVLIGVLFVSAVLTTASLIVNVPLLVFVWLGRGRVHRRLACGVLAAAFAATSAYLNYRAEWLDVWQHGMPSIRYILWSMGPPTALSATVGWLVGMVLTQGSAAKRSNIGPQA